MHALLNQIEDDDDSNDDHISDAKIVHIAENVQLLREDAALTTESARSPQVVLQWPASLPDADLDAISNESHAKLDLMLKFYAYREVVQKRYIDSVSMYLRHHYPIFLKHNLASRLRDLAMSDGCCAVSSNDSHDVNMLSSDSLLLLMGEDALAKVKRAQLVERAATLDKAIDRINRMR